ncbi:hypothetical protein SDC9_154667 [bioreactor metagenome]|uniref:Uncharacterized protein n=1 Tax=bioreactor metagenome TaxID=1076179 RepID=A0A645EZN4_9ZZZZ
MKKPNTPSESRQNHEKNSLVSGAIFHEMNVPVSTMIEERHSMATDTPSTPNENPRFSGLYHMYDDVKSMPPVTQPFPAVT